MYLDSSKYITRAQAVEEFKARWNPEPGVEAIPVAQALGRGAV